MTTKEFEVEEPVPSRPMDLIGHEPVREVKQFYIYEAPVRIWHWLTALGVFVLAITGYFIASPLPTLSGEASDHFLLGYIRAVHFIFAYLFTIGMIWRTYWALTGDAHARQIFYIPVWDKKFWSGVLDVLKWYTFIERRPHRWVAHNALARASMFGMFILGSFFMFVTGFALYSEGQGTNSLTYKLFGWVIGLVGGSMQLHTLHHLGMWLLILFSMFHIYAAIRDDIMGRVSAISSMVSGWRAFRDSNDD